MKLTNYMRDAFVRAVMDDVPSINYDEKIRDAMLKAAVDALPPKLKAIWKDPDLRGYLALRRIHTRTWCIAAHVPGLDDDTATATVREVVEPMHEARDAQEKSRDELRSRVKAVAYSVSTRKALAEMLPEFERYLPADEAAALRSVPVVANLAEQLKAAGWKAPKAKEEVAA